MRVEMSQRQPKSVNEDNVRVRLYGWWWERSKDDECSVQLDFISPWLLTWLVVLWRYPLGPHVAGNSCVDRFPDSGLWRHTRLFALNTPPPPKNCKSAISLEFTKRVNIQKWVMFWAKLIQSQCIKGREWVTLKSIYNFEFISNKPISPCSCVIPGPLSLFPLIFLFIFIHLSNYFTGLVLEQIFPRIFR